MFDIVYIPSKGNEQPETLIVYGVPFELRTEKKWFWIIPRVCLGVTASVVIGVTLIVFVGGIILNVIYLPPNENCPKDSDMDCYSTSGNNSYFYCNSSDTFIPTSLGSVTCYRWFKKGISTLEILEQIGLCAGLIQVFNWIVNLYLRLLLYSYTCCTQTTISCCSHMYLAWISTTFAFLGPLIALGILGAREVGVTGLTMAVLSCTSFIVLMMLILIWAWKINAYFVRAAEISNQKVVLKSNEVAVISVQL
ncbi:unnamed protein product [Rotaria socialis]|uniref:Uncharacterized protein n=1 Tax=Rotaria socialis TaxID=392032 RepID=A0A820WYZ3_9BILA|nr:unnamed protein product [Rotaria socialis]CAF4524229.1 unnamed protein product [Rotaria socialis]